MACARVTTSSRPRNSLFTWMQPQAKFPEERQYIITATQGSVAGVKDKWCEHRLCGWWWGERERKRLYMLSLDCSNHPCDTHWCICALLHHCCFVAASIVLSAASLSQLLRWSSICHAMQQVSAHLWSATCQSQLLACSTARTATHAHPCASPNLVASAAAQAALAPTAAWPKALPRLTLSAFRTPHRRLPAPEPGQCGQPRPKDLQADLHDAAHQPPVGLPCKSLQRKGCVEL